MRLWTLRIQTIHAQTCNQSIDVIEVCGHMSLPVSRGRVSEDGSHRTPDAPKSRSEAAKVDFQMAGRATVISVYSSREQIVNANLNQHDHHPQVVKGPRRCRLVGESMPLRTIEGLNFQSVATRRHAVRFEVCWSMSLAVSITVMILGGQGLPGQSRTPPGGAGRGITTGGRTRGGDLAGRSHRSERGQSVQALLHGGLTTESRA